MSGRTPAGHHFSILLLRQVFTIFRRKKTPAPETADFIVAGLGNPGRKYETTRHNAGFLAVDLLCQEYGGERMHKVKCNALYTFCRIDGKNVLVMKPQTYMNLSGEAVRDMAHAFQVPPERVIVVFDDVAIPCGAIRVKRKGSDGGHNGIKSIIYCLKSADFPRVKIGVGGPGQDDMVDHVLGELDTDAYQGVKLAPAAVADIIKLGVDQAMQRHNTKPQSEKPKPERKKPQPPAAEAAAPQAEAQPTETQGDGQ